MSNLANSIQTRRDDLQEVKTPERPIETRESLDHLVKPTVETVPPQEISHGAQAPSVQIEIDLHRPQAAGPQHGSLHVDPLQIQSTPDLATELTHDLSYVAGPQQELDLEPSFMAEAERAPEGPWQPFQSQNTAPTGPRLYRMGGTVLDKIVTWIANRIKVLEYRLLSALSRRDTLVTVIKTKRKKKPGGFAESLDDALTTDTGLDGATLAPRDPSAAKKRSSAAQGAARRDIMSSRESARELNSPAGTHIERAKRGASKE